MARPDLPSALVEQALTRGAERHPKVQVDRAQLAAFLAERIARAPSAALHLEDLYLAAALAAKDPSAIAVFEAEHLGKLGPALARLSLTAADLADVRAELSLRLLVDPGRITDYAGTGALLRWVRAAAVRTALNLVERRTRQSQTELPPSSLSAAATDPDLRLIRSRYREPFKAALTASLARLDPEARLLLRQYYADGLGVEALGRLYRVSASTCSRRLAAARDHLSELLRGELTQIAQGSELESLVRDLQSQLTFSRNLFG